MRRLLIIEATRRAPMRPIARASGAAPFAHRERPARRRVFRVLPAARTPSRTSARGAKADPSTLIPSAPLALRFDALVGALANRAPLITRLARRLYARDPRARGLVRVAPSTLHGVDEEGRAIARAAADFLEAFFARLQPAPNTS